MFFNKKKTSLDTEALIAEIEIASEKLATAERLFTSRIAAGTDVTESTAAAEYIKKSRAALASCSSALSITLPPKDKRRIRGYEEEQRRILSEMNSASADAGLCSCAKAQRIYDLALELCECQKKLATV